MAAIPVNTRCYLNPIVEMITELKKQMNKQHWEILHKIPFAHFMDVTPMLQERGLLNTLLKAYDNCS